MDKSFDQLIGDVRAARERLARLVRDLCRETCRVGASDGSDGPASGLDVIADKLWTRMQLEDRGCCALSCERHEGANRLRLQTIERRARRDRAIFAKGYELEGLMISVFVIRCFNAAMALTQCRLCAAALVWKMVQDGMPLERGSVPPDGRV